jgi:Ca2+-binding RTX toxin-like protein
MGLFDKIDGGDLFKPVDGIEETPLFANPNAEPAGNKDKPSSDGDDKGAKQNDGETSNGNGGAEKDLGGTISEIIKDLTDGDSKFDTGLIDQLANQLVTIGKGRKFGKGGDGDDEITIESDDGAIAYGGKGNDKLVGGRGNDKLIGKYGSNKLSGGEGDDIARGGEGNDSILGGQGNDRGIGGDGDDLINGDEGDDILRGDLGRDTINGGADNDRLFGFADEDSVMGGDGDDIVRGGLANDMLYGGNGKDIIRGGEDEDYIEGGNGNDKLYGGNGNDSLLGEEGNDRLEGQSGRDTLDGGAGDDNLRGGSEDDLIFGGLGDDFVQGGTGDDAITGAEGADTIHGESGADSITGDAGNDRLFGGNGRDTVDGGVGNDVVNGGSEDDSLSGGEGNDTLGGASGDDTVRGEAGNDRVNGGSGDDFLFGGAGDDALDGGSNADVIDAGDGDDSITGGSGNDVMNGGAGHDLFVSDAGDDTMTGGEGSEWYFYENEDFGHDLIQDFQAVNGDLLDLSRTGFTRADLNVRQVTEDMITIDVPGDRSITLAGNSKLDINSAAIHFGDNDGAVELRDFIKNGSFENVTETGDVLGAFNGNGNGQHDTTEVVWYKTVEGWASNDGRVEVKGEDASGAFAIDAADGKFYAELDDGSSNAQHENNELHQDVAGLTIGRSYALSFDFANNAGSSDGHVDVFFGGEKVGSISSNSSNFATKTFNVVGGAGDGSDRLAFVTGNTGNEAGAYIDNVKLLGYVNTDGALTPVDAGGNDTVTGEDGNDTVAGGGEDTVSGGGNDNGGGADDQQEFIVNGSFENLSPSIGNALASFNGNSNGVHDTTEVVWYSSVEGWDSRDGRIEVKGEDASGAFAIDAADGKFYVELDDGSSRAQFENNELNQTVDGLTEGETYTLTFDSANNAGNSDGHIDVFFGGQKIGSVTSNSGSFQENSFEVTGGFGNGSDKLSFVTSNSNNEAGAFIDNVSLKGAAPVAAGNSEVTDVVVPDGETFTGTSGKDTLRGTDRDDVLEGGAKRDKLFGGDGDDTLNGGEGNDVVTGGDGADTFTFDSLNFGNDRIKDFDASEGDRLDFSRIADELSDLTILQSGGDTLIEAGNGSIQLNGVKVSEFDAAEVSFFG